VGQHGILQHAVLPWTKTGASEYTDCVQHIGPRASCTDSNLFKNMEMVICTSRLYSRSEPALQTAFTPCLTSYDLLSHDESTNTKPLTSVACALVKLQSKHVPTPDLIQFKYDRLGRFPELIQGLVFILDHISMDFNLLGQNLEVSPSFLVLTSPGQQRRSYVRRQCHLSQ